MTAFVMSSSYDVLGDASEYEEWLASQQSQDSGCPERASEAIQDDRKQQIQSIEDLPAELADVVMHLEQQHASVILSAYQGLQHSR